MLEIRAARDAAELEKLIGAVCRAFGDMQPDDWQFDDVRAGLATHPELLIGAWDSDTPAGAVLAFVDPDGPVRARILGVTTPYRGRGLAAWLMDALERAARGIGAPYIHLGTQHARGLYEGLGYVCTSVLDGPERPEPTYVMRLDLPDDDGPRRAG